MSQKRSSNELDSETLNFWRAQIESAEKWSNQWRTRGSKIVDRYRSIDRAVDTSGSNDADKNTSGYNILYSNTDTMLPVLYSETPRPEVRATNIKDLTARHAAEMLEKTLEYSIDSNDYNYMMERVVKDLLLPGLGQCRVKVDTAFSQEEVEDENGETQEEDRVAIQRTTSEYVNWDDYIVPETTSWDDRPWEAFRGRMTFDEVEDMFDEEAALTVEYTVDDQDGNNKKRNVGTKDTSEAFKKATIYEIWDKEKQEQIFISKGGVIRSPLEINEDPLGLDGFFSTPRPVLSVTTNNTILPVPLFILYQDQADELDIITERITRLVAQLRRRGLYDSAMKEINRLSTAGDNEFIGVKDLARLQDKGGLSAVFMTEDVTPFANVLLGLYNQRDQILNIIFQIVGISDIQRAVTDPRETASAQRIKARFGSLRISRIQREIQRFIRDMLRLQAEIIINTFTPKVLSTITGLPIDTKIDEDGTVVEFGTTDLLEKLQNQEPSSVLVDIETDSTIAKDELADKEEIVEFNSVITNFAASAPVLQQVIGTDATAEMLLSLVRKFKMGRRVEQAVIDQVDVAKQKQAQQEQEPSAEQLEAQAKQQELQQKAENDNVKNQIEFGKLQLKEKELELKAAELGLKDNIDQQKVDFLGIQTAIELQKTELDEQKFQVEAANPDVNVVVGV